MSRSKVDWEAIEREYRAGQLSLSEIARQHNITHQAISKRAKDQKWARNLAKAVRDTIRAKLVADEVADGNARETVEIAALRGVAVVRSHQRALSQLNAISDILATRLSQHLDGVAMDGPGLGERESPADMLEKLSRTRQRAIQLERQAFNLDANPGDDPESPDKTIGDRDRAKAVAALIMRAKSSGLEA